MKKHYTSYYVSIIAILLSCVGAISVGFASWIISQGDSTTTSGNINADVVDTKINGVTITSSSVINYGHYFFDEGTTYEQRSTATISYNIHFDGSQIVPNGSTSHNLPLSASLSFGDGTLPIFVKTTYITSILFGSEGSEENIINNVTFANNKAITFDLNENITSTSYNADKKLEFTISNKMIIKYGDLMNGGKFYLRLETD